MSRRAASLSWSLDAERRREHRPCKSNEDTLADLRDVLGEGPSRHGDLGQRSCATVRTRQAHVCTATPEDS